MLPKMYYLIFFSLSLTICSSQNDSGHLKYQTTNETYQIKLNVESDRNIHPKENLKIANETQIENDSKIQNKNSKATRKIQPDQIKEDDKNGTIDNVVTNVYTVIEEPLESDQDMTEKTRKNTEDTNDSSKTTEISTTELAFSPSPYLGSVIEEVIEEPIARHRDISIETDFIPMRSRESSPNQIFEEIKLFRQFPTFQTGSSVPPVFGETYTLHSENSINSDFENPNFNENPFGRIKFPDEKSKYFPIFLADNEIIGTQEKPLKFDYEGNLKQYEFPYKIENTIGAPPEVTEENKSVAADEGESSTNLDDGKNNVHGHNIMKDINVSLPLDLKKSYAMKYPHSTWKKVAHTVMAFLPIGLMLAAIPPKVIKLNSTNHWQREGLQSVRLPNSMNPYYFKNNINSRRAQ